MRFARKNFSNQKKRFCNQNVRRELDIGGKSFFESKSSFRISRGARFRLGSTHRQGRFWNIFWLKSLRNDRFYKDLAPKRGWNLPPPAGLRPASPFPPKKLFRFIVESKKFFWIKKVLFESKVFLNQIRAAEKQSKKLIAKKLFGPKPSFWLKKFFLRFRLRKN